MIHLLHLLRRARDRFLEPLPNMLLGVPEDDPAYADCPIAHSNMAAYEQGFERGLETGYADAFAEKGE